MKGGSHGKETAGRISKKTAESLQHVPGHAGSGDDAGAGGREERGAAQQNRCQGSGTEPAGSPD